MARHNSLEKKSIALKNCFFLFLNARFLLLSYAASLCKRATGGGTGHFRASTTESAKSTDAPCRGAGNYMDK